MIIYRATLARLYSPTETRDRCRDMATTSLGKRRRTFGVLASFNLVQFSSAGAFVVDDFLLPFNDPLPLQQTCSPLR